MARKSKVKIKTGGKIVIMVVAAVLLFVGYKFGAPYIIPQGKGQEDISGLMAGSSSSATPARTGNCIEIGVVTWGGYAGGQYWNNGFKDNDGSRFRKDGLCVNFSVMDDFNASRAAFKSGNMDLMWVTIDAFPTESGSYGETVKFLFQADWSRGGDAIVVKQGINDVGQLAGKKIAVAEATPSHTFLLWMLDSAGLSIMDVNLVKSPSAIDAAAAFKSGQVDAAVVWSPDDAACVEAVKDSRILVNTKQATHIIADGFMVKESYLNANRDKLKKLVEGWLKGSAEINESIDARHKAAKILAAGFTGVNEKFTFDAIGNVRLTTLGDNKDFFGLNPSYKGMTGKSIYEKMSVVYGRLNLAEKPLKWDQIIDIGFINSLQVDGGAAETEKRVAFVAPTAADTTAKAVTSKPVRISFAHGSTELDDSAMGIIDMMFVEQAKAFPTSRIRVEGNTDSTGSAAINKRISLQRAQAVVNYLVNEHGFDPNRFIAVGNGPDKPVCGENTPACMSKNRRTDFQILEM